jgi:hypothetical protein
MKHYRNQAISIRHSILKFFLLSAVLFLAGCAPSRFKKLQASYDAGEYERVTQSDITCGERSVPCFQIAYLKAESYYQLDDLNNALKYSAQATALIPSNLSVSQANEAFLLQGKLALLVYPGVHGWENRTSFLRDVESSLKIGIEKNRLVGKTDKTILQSDSLKILLAEILLHKMDLYSDSNLDIQYDQLMAVISSLSPQLIQDGIQKYYFLQGELKKIMPQVKAWIYQGKLSDHREILLEELKSLYRETLAVRNLPLYDGGYRDQIDLLLKQIDDYMKRLII